MDTLIESIDDQFFSLFATKKLSSAEALNILDRLFHIFYQRSYYENEQQKFEPILINYGFQGMMYVAYKIAASDDRINKAKQQMISIWQKSLSRNPTILEFEQNIEKIAFVEGPVISSLEKEIEESEKFCLDAKGKSDSGMYQEAKEILERALNDGIPSWKAWHEYGLLLKRLDKHEEAILMYEKAIHKNELDDNWNWSCFDCLACLQILSKKDKKFLRQGYEFFKAVADRFPQRPSVFHCYAWCAWEIGNQQEACEAYKGAILCNHQTDQSLISWSCFDLLERYKLMGAQNDAIIFFNEISQKRLSIWAIWHCLGQLELRYKNDPLKAIEYYDLAISRHPNKNKADKWSYYDKAIALFYLKKYEEAYKYHALSVKNIDPAENTIWLWLDFGKTCEALEKKQEAIDCYMQGLQLSFFEPCLFLLKEAYKKLAPTQEISVWKGYKSLLDRYPDEQKIKSLIQEFESSHKIHRELRNFLQQRLNLSELRIIVFELNIDVDNLSQDKNTFIVDLINYCKKRSMVGDLLAVVNKLYPHVLS